MDLAAQFADIVKREKLFTTADHLILAVSGGVDSIVLTDLCARSGFSFSVAHCNFQLRNEESERDAIFVRTIAERYGVSMYEKRFDTARYATEHKVGIQEAARSLRYEWFAQLIDEQHAAGQAFLLTAHHADDNIETAVMNFFRGTGLKGLRGIPAARDRMRRPLLGFWKEELTTYATEHGLSWVEDASNASSKYSRNFFRNELIPAAAKVYPQVKENLRSNIERFRDIVRLYDDAVAKMKEKLYRREGETVRIPVKQLMYPERRALLFEVLTEFHFSEKQVDELARLASSDSGKHISSPDGAFRILKFRNWLIISPAPVFADHYAVIDELPASTAVAGNAAGTSWRMTITKREFRAENTAMQHMSADPMIACLDADTIEMPLIIRKPKTGDYFYPLGMRKKKKVARFFIDQKLPLTEREAAFIIEMDRKILWVAPFRIDDRFRITPQTKSILEIRLETV